MKNTTIRFALHNRSTTEGLHSVVLRITKDRQKKEIHLDIKCKAEHFKDDRLTKSHPTHKADNDLLLKLYAKAVDVVEDFEREDYDFTLDEFKTKFKGVQKYQDSNIVKFFNEIIDELTRSGRTGNARAYEESKAALVKFAGENLSFKSISPTFLEKFEVFLRENKNGNGGISFKMSL
ncbi:MAG: phage integrase SAM-like domain-containing protein [Bacteroidota bacterium]